MQLILDFQQLKRTSGLQILNVHGIKFDNVKDVTRTNFINRELLNCSSFILLYDLSNGFEYNLIKCRYYLTKEVWNGSETVSWTFKPNSLSDVYNYLKDIDEEVQRDRKNLLCNFYEKFEKCLELKN